ncbi:(d)CMP kinase [Buchnera aphidicola]|uniref:(d)CMP kinase n=1 Tax=Buchnera aphidicola TaxID=9 RepID=UPI0034647EDC
MILPLVITVDGPSASGKSTLCKLLANNLRWFHLDSGVIYRILACLFVQYNVPMLKKFLTPILRNLDFYFIYKNGLIYNLIKKHFSYRYIMSKKITYISSKLATIPYVRNYLLIKQRLFRRYPGLIANGRDMGTVVFPDAIIKIFLNATLEARAYRRMIDLKKKGTDINYQDVLNQIYKRDYRDKNRICSPLNPAHDAFILDSSKLSISHVLKIVLQHIKNNNNFKIKSVYN